MLLHSAHHLVWSEHHEELGHGLRNMGGAKAVPYQIERATRQPLLLENKDLTASTSTFQKKALPCSLITAAPLLRRQVCFELG
jgi:hypothetical protein